MEASSLSAASVGRQRQRERDVGVREKAAGRIAWNDLEMGVKKYIS